ALTVISKDSNTSAHDVGERRLKSRNPITARALRKMNLFTRVRKEHITLCGRTTAIPMRSYAGYSITSLIQHVKRIIWSIPVMIVAQYLRRNTCCNEGRLEMMLNKFALHHWQHQHAGIVTWTI